jgi:hypothetical protein
LPVPRSPWDSWSDAATCPSTEQTLLVLRDCGAAHAKFASYHVVGPECLNGVIVVDKAASASDESIRVSRIVLSYVAFIRNTLANFLLSKFNARGAGDIGGDPSLGLRLQSQGRGRQKPSDGTMVRETYDAGLSRQAKKDGDETGR